jgi:hypothetical protein
MKVSNYLAISLVSTLMLGCGGGSGGKKSSSGSPIKNTLNGSWKTSCLPTKSGESLLSYVLHDIEEGIYGEGLETYVTSDCSGSPDATVKLGGPVTYSGALPTSICTAEKFDSTFNTLEVDGREITGALFDAAMSQISNVVPKTRSSLACIYNGIYLKGFDQKVVKDLLKLAQFSSIVKQMRR